MKRTTRYAPQRFGALGSRDLGLRSESAEAQIVEPEVRPSTPRRRGPRKPPTFSRCRMRPVRLPLAAEEKRGAQWERAKRANVYRDRSGRWRVRLACQAGSIVVGRGREAREKAYVLANLHRMVDVPVTF